MTQSVYCIARVGEIIERSEGCEIELVLTELPDVGSVIEFLKGTYDRFATQIADQNAERSDEDRIELSTIGGFGVQLKNRFGSEIEIGLGRKFCLLIRLVPKPTKICRSNVQNDDTLVFFVDGWHHTEMSISELVPRDLCLSYLRDWLDYDTFPDTA
jgi:hypothetical protein